jgi:23S rRNA pseudouridine1911/1915/1917 synthase
MPADSSFLSFPPDTLSREPLRIPILARTDAWFALNKPAGVPWHPDPWIPRATDLVREVRGMLRAGKPQLARLGIAEIHGITGPDLVASGLVLCAANSREGARLANALGSGQVELRYRFLTAGRSTDASFDCTLPLAPHATESRMTVARGFGKKTETHFQLEQRFRGWALWNATTTFDRVHQIRLHAAECGLTVVGETRYGKSPHVFLSDIKRGYRPAAAAERPLYDNLGLHLAGIHFTNTDGSPVTVECPLPKGFGVLLRRLAEHAPA